MRASFLFVGAIIVSGCDQLVVGLTHARGGILDLRATYIPDKLSVAIVAPINNADHSSLSEANSMAHAVLNLCVSRKVNLKHQVDWNSICGALQNKPWCNIWSAYNPVEVSNKHLSLLVGHYVCTTRISPGLMINAGIASVLLTSS